MVQHELWWANTLMLPKLNIGKYHLRNALIDEIIEQESPNLDSWRGSWRSCDPVIPLNCKFDEQNDEMSDPDPWLQLAAGCVRAPYRERGFLTKRMETNVAVANPSLLLGQMKRQTKLVVGNSPRAKSPQHEASNTARQCQASKMWRQLTVTRSENSFLIRCRAVPRFLPHMYKAWKIMSDISRTEYGSL